MTRTVLLNPGPVNVTDSVRDSLLRGDMCHREKEIADLVQNIRHKLLKAFGIEGQYLAALITGSGTAALEMAVSSCLSQDKSLLVIQNGVYGERIGKMADAYGHRKIALDYAWGEPPKMTDIEQALTRHPEIEVVAMVHHETTTGLMNPLTEVHALCRKHNKKLLVDAISSLAGEPFNFNETPADIVVGTANKCIQGYPGVSFVLVRQDDVDRLGQAPTRSVYLNLHKNLIAQEKGDTLFTPAVQVHYAFDQALDELIEETVAGRVDRYRKAAEHLRRGFRELELELLLAEPLLSNSLTALRLPEGIPYETLHRNLRDNGFVIYAGQGDFSATLFRIANMGDIQEQEFDRFLQQLSACLVQSGKV